jgi:hypothetical protein
MLNKRNVGKFPYKNLDLMIISSLDIIQGLCNLFTLGFWKPNLSSNYLHWRVGY